MSTAKGNTTRTRPQKHKNRTSFKNNLHDTSHRTKFINSIDVCHVCQRCKDIIEWKIKYKKYKPLTQPAKCVKCEQRNVRYAYHVMCTDCGKKLALCTKCCQVKEVVPAPIGKVEEQQLDAEMHLLIETLPERKRRTIIRKMNKEGRERDDAMAKLKLLKESCDIDKLDLNDFDDDSDVSDSVSDDSN